MAIDNILIIGSNGQVGSALVHYLCDIYGENHVIASDLREPEQCPCRFEQLDVTDAVKLAGIVRRYKITQIYHLAAILSAKGENDPLSTWDLNTQTYFNILEVSRAHHVKKIFFPSSIAVFGEHVNREKADQWSYLMPTTAYGLSKAASENWSNYYHIRYGLDIRSLRYPGIISYQSMPGGGTTDYAVDIYHKAVLNEAFTCFLREDSTLPMIYIDDALRATVNLMEAPEKQISIRTSYNLSGVSFSPEEITAEILKIYPDFSVSYQPDFRQKIADSWPKSIDDAMARLDWGWNPEYDLTKMTKTMIEHLNEKYQLHAHA